MKKVRLASLLIILFSVLVLFFSYILGDRLQDLKIYASILLAGILGFLFYAGAARLVKKDKFAVIIGFALAALTFFLVFFRWDIFVEQNKTTILSILFFLPVIFITSASLVLYFARRSP